MINDTVTDYLIGQRYYNLDENSRLKRKKLTVLPGVSITAATMDLNNVLSDEELDIVSFTNE